MLYYSRKVQLSFPILLLVSFHILFCDSACQAKKSLSGVGDSLPPPAANLESSAPTTDSPSSQDTMKTVQLHYIGHFTPKGRVQDQQPPLAEVEALIAMGPGAVDFLVARIEDETKVAERVLDFWGDVVVGDVAFCILMNFFVDSDWQQTTVPQMGWNDVLNNRDPAKPSWVKYYEFIEQHGRDGLRREIERRLKPYADRLQWDTQARCFRPF